MAREAIWTVMKHFEMFPSWKQGVLKSCRLWLFEKVAQKTNVFAYMLLLDGGFGGTAPVFTYLEEWGHDCWGIFSFLLGLNSLTVLNTRTRFLVHYSSLFLFFCCCCWSVESVWNRLAVYLSQWTLAHLLICFFLYRVLFVCFFLFFYVKEDAYYWCMCNTRAHVILYVCKTPCAMQTFRKLALYI